MEDILQSTTGLQPEVAATPKESFAEKMKAAKEKKKTGQTLADVQTPKPPAPPKTPYVPRQQYSPPPSKKPVKPADQFIFRLMRKNHAALDKINVDFVWRPHTYTAPTSTILWPYEVSKAGRVPLPLTDDLTDLNDENGVPRTDLQWLPRTVRYIYSANSPFVDEQEKQFGDTLKKDAGGFNEITDNPQNRDALVFMGLELKVQAYDTVLVSFLRLSGQCGNMHPKARRRSQNPIYTMLDFGQVDKDKVEIGKLRRAMYQIAGDAKLEEMIPHAKHLGISFFNSDGADRELDAIREDYKDAALANPAEFERTFRDPKIKIMHQIITLKDAGQLVISAGRAKWAHSNAIITLIPPNANPIEFLAGFSLDNKDFQEQLEASKVLL